ncbi:uncharacterized protein LOC142239389 [Haematobia irritans]|uniref:uncharacterized protein LOC142239389 n=1 Tax=Haematobia irritans TaxID=7368 RepID=UPI003F4FDD84
MENNIDNSNEELRKLLTEWNLEQHYENFVQHKITMKILRILQHRHVERLFAKATVGDQAIFEHRLEIWKQTMLLEDFPISNSKKIESPATNTTCTTIEKTLEEKIQPKEIPLELEHTSNDYSPQIPEIYVGNESNDTADDDLLETLESSRRKSHAYTPLQVKSFQGMNRSPHMIPPLSRTSHGGGIPSSGSSSNMMPTMSPNISAGMPQITSNMSPSMATNMMSNMIANMSHNMNSPNMGMPAPSSNLAMDQSQLQSSAPVRYNLSKILTETSGGQIILNYYDKHKILREEHRTALINVIARYIDANGCNLTLAESNSLEGQIVQMFPTEREEFYRTAKRGRLYNKIANMKRVYKKFKKDVEHNVSASNPSSPVTSIIKEEFIEELDDAAIQEMREKIQSNEEFLEFWRRTQTSRLKDIDNIDSLHDILEKWQEYKQPNVMDYITMDFQAKFPTATRFSDVFYANFAKVEKMLFAKISTGSAGYKHLQIYRTANIECKYLIMLWVLHQLFPPSHQTKVDEMGVKRKKRYSIQDSQNSCICIRNSRAGIESMLCMRTTATPPMILVVGDMASEIEEISVHFEGYQYPCHSVVQAAEICLSIIFPF